MSGAITHGPSTVHKFDVAISDVATVLPLCLSARVVHIGHQGAVNDGRLQLWALVPLDAAGRPCDPGDGRRFFVHGTGHPIPGGREHVGTVFDGPFVWHVFEDVSGRGRA